MGWCGNYKNTEQVINNLKNHLEKGTVILDTKHTKNWGAILYKRQDNTLDIEFFIFDDGCYKPLSWVDRPNLIPVKWVNAVLPFSDEYVLKEYERYKETKRKKEKEPKLDDILVVGQKYKIWDKYIVTYRFKQKRTHIFELEDGSLTKFTNLKLSGVKTLDGRVPELISLSTNNLDIIYKPINTGNFMKDCEVNYKNLRSIDQKVKALGGILGRYVQEPYADGYAVYQVVEEKSSKVKLRLVTGIGDDWVIPMWGKEAMVDKSYVQTSIYRRDKMAELFSKK